MKNYFLLFIAVFCLRLVTKAQELNWRSLHMDYKHQLALNIGADYGTTFGGTYGRQLSGKLPVVLGVEIAIPFGNNLWDDWKIKVSGQGELWHNNRFSIGLKPGIIVRKYQSDVAKLYNIGTELTATLGYFRSKWGIAGEVNYDKPLLTQIRHGILKEYYPAIRDGWYGSSGGNFKFGIKTNYALGKWGIFLKVGKAYGQDFENNPTLPFFFDLSISKYL